MKITAVIMTLLIVQLGFGQSDTAQPEKIFTIVDQMPSFPGGEKEMMRFIQQNVVYPAYEKKKDIQGRVVLGFNVNADGSLSDIQVKRGISPGIDAEALRVVRLFPRFEPGREKGIPVKVSYMLPIAFKLQ